jgi:hypothetical protein
MKPAVALFFLFCLFCVLPSCGLRRATDGVPAGGYNFSNVVAGIVKLHKEADDERSDKGLVYEHWQLGAPARLPDEFDPNEYFSVLKHLSMADGYVLDFAYLVAGGDGRPFLYARRQLFGPFRTWKDYEEAVGGRRAAFRAEKAFLNKVRADGSPESFFELVALYELGGQFYLEWHFCYDDTRIVASPGDVEQVIRDPSLCEYDRPFTQRQLDEARLLDVRPRVSFIDEDTVEVSVVLYSGWGGFTRKTYRIRRDFPHTVVETQSETLLEYDCGAVI